MTSAGYRHTNEKPGRCRELGSRGVVAAGRGIALAGLTLAAVGLWAALLAEVAFALPGAGLPPIPGTLRATRRR
jgi:hypothetical protein